MKLPEFSTRLVQIGPAFFFALVSHLLLAQYEPFPTDDAIWTVSASNEESLDVTIHYVTFLMQGDTTINGQNYAKLYGKHSQTANYWEGGGWTTSYVIDPYTLVAGIREDENKKVWAYGLQEFSSQGYMHLITVEHDLPYLSEYLLFDFNLELGDSINMEPYGLPETVEVVDEYTHANGRRVLELQQEFGNSRSWMEGVGGLYGGPFSRFLGFGFYSINLECFYHTGEWIIGDGADCQSVQNLSENSLDASSIFTHSINSTTETLSILFKRPGNKIVRIIDLSGRVIYSDRTNKDLMEVQINSFAAGVHLIEVQSDELVATTKIQLMH